MELSVQTHGEVLVITPAAAPMTLEATNAGDFRASVEATVVESEVRQVVLDMRPIEFVDSSGLSAIIALSRALRRQGGELRLAGLQRYVWTVFEVTRLYRAFEIHDTVDEAVESFLDW